MTKHKKIADQERDTTIISGGAIKKAERSFLDAVLDTIENIPVIGGAIKFFRGLFD